MVCSLLSSETPSAELLHQTALRLSTGQPGDLSTELGASSTASHTPSLLCLRADPASTATDRRGGAHRAHVVRTARRARRGVWPPTWRERHDRSGSLPLLAAVKPVWAPGGRCWSKRSTTLAPATGIRCATRTTARSTSGPEPERRSDVCSPEATITPARSFVLKQTISTGLGSPQSMVYEPIFPSRARSHARGRGQAHHRAGEPWTCGSG